MYEPRTPVVPDHGQTTVQIKATNDVGHRPIRVIAWDNEGYPLTVGRPGTDAEGRLIRAQDRDDFHSVSTRKHASEREVDVPAAAGWRVRIVKVGPSILKLGWDLRVGEEYPVMMWRYLGPADVRPVIPRPRRDTDGNVLEQRGYDPMEMKVVVHLIAPGEEDSGPRDFETVQDGSAVADVMVNSRK